MKNLFVFALLLPLPLFAAERIEKLNVIITEEACRPSRTAPTCSEQIKWFEFKQLELKETINPTPIAGIYYSGTQEFAVNTRLANYRIVLSVSELVIAEQTEPTHKKYVAQIFTAEGKSPVSEVLIEDFLGGQISLRGPQLSDGHGQTSLLLKFGPIAPKPGGTDPYPGTSGGT